MGSYTTLLPPILPPVEDPKPRIPTRRIHIRHPHYPDQNNVLIRLYAPDHPEGGLQYDFVMVVCGIVTGNRWDGWLTESKNGPRVEKEPDEILEKGNYFFHLRPSNTGLPYPIVPSFREWNFPHDNLPERWKLFEYDSSPSKIWKDREVALLVRDHSCRICGYREGTKVADICPKEESDWYIRNQMDRYHCNMFSSGLDDAANAALLREDLHLAFNNRSLVFIPKCDADKGDGKVHFVTHVFEASEEFEKLYHNHILHKLTDVRPEYLFARLAWTIFPLLNIFLRSGLAPHLIIANKEGGWTSITQRADGDVP